MGKNTIVKDTLILLAITLIAGLLLGKVYDVTKEPIAAQAEKAKQEAYEKVYPGGSFTEDDALTAALAEFTPDSDGAAKKAQITEVMSANNGEGYVFSCQANGYGGAVKLAVGVTADSTITGISVLSMSETPGLGAKCQDASFQEQFTGIQSEKLTINQEFDQISGATITSTAVTCAVNAALKFVAENAN